jgi:tetratricopeptide (TPR) repeat protein
LLEELQQNRPILVLQNYGLDSMPAYHYAVVIGVDVAGCIILRSGTRERVEMSLTTFLMSWRRPGSWGMIVLRPGELPARPDKERYLKAVSAFENAGYKAEATPAYQAALAKWPEDDLVSFALANNYLERGQNDSAEELYRHILRDTPGNLAAANNLAETLMRKGCGEQAKTLITDAVNEAQRHGSPFLDTLKETEAEVSRSKREAVERNCEDSPKLIR